MNYNTTDLQKCVTLGKDGHAAGKTAPMQDSALMAVLEENRNNCSQFLKAWSYGWAVAHNESTTVLVTVMQL